MVFKFTMINGDEVVRFAVTSAAMDDLEHASSVRPNQRAEQFARIRNVIEERAARKYFATERNAGANAEIVLRTNDFKG